jgi:hypothetical protein
VILPKWATLLTAPAVCKCDYAFPAAVHIEVEVKCRRPNGGRGGAAERDYAFTFEYDLCLVCLAYEREVRGELSYSKSERIAAELIVALSNPPSVALVDDDSGPPPAKIRTHIKRKCTGCERRIVMPVDSALCRRCTKKLVEVAA